MNRNIEEVHTVSVQEDSISVNQRCSVRARDTSLMGLFKKKNRKR